MKNIITTIRFKEFTINILTFVSSNQIIYRPSMPVFRGIDYTKIGFKTIEEAMMKGQEMIQEFIEDTMGTEALEENDVIELFAE